MNVRILAPIAIPTVPKVWTALPRTTRRRLHGTYYAWWYAETLRVGAPACVDHAMSVYLQAKYSEIEISRNTLANLRFQMSIEGRMNVSLSRFFATHPLDRERVRLLDELANLKRQEDHEQEQAVYQAVDQLSAAYIHGFSDACGLPMRFARGCFEAKQ